MTHNGLEIPKKNEQNNEKYCWQNGDLGIYLGRLESELDYGDSATFMLLRFLLVLFK